MHGDQRNMTKIFDSCNTHTVYTVSRLETIILPSAMYMEPGKAVVCMLLGIHCLMRETG